MTEANSIFKVGYIVVRI